MTVDSLLLDSPLESPWERCLQSLEDVIPETAYHTWFPRMQYVELTDTTLTLGTPNHFVLDYVSHHYRDIIQETVSKVLEKTVSVQFVDLDTSCTNIDMDSALPEKEEPFQEEVSPLVRTSKGPTRIDSNLALNPNYTFEDFVIGDCNQLAHAACLAVAEAPNNNSFNPLILYGGTGLGKTHLLQAIAHFIRDAETAKKVVYRSSEDFTREYIQFVHKNKDSRSFARVYQDADVLIIDDIQFLAGKKSTQEEFYNILNNLQQLNKQIVISSDRLPSEIKGLHSRLLSRFDRGLFANMQPPELETRLAILKKKQENSGTSFITDEVLSYVANAVTSNIRELEGTLIKLSAYANFTHVPVTIDIAKQVLGDTLRNVHKSITIKTILDHVAKYFKVPVPHLTSQSRKKNVATPRQIAMYLARELTDNSLHTIGLAFSRDYSTVIHSLKKIEKQMITGSEFARGVSDLRDILSRL
jgi:chromosomal replication initiator protein